MDNIILVDNSLGAYMSLINSKFATNTIFFTNSIEQMYNVDFDKIYVLIIFVNDTYDLFDFGCLNSKPLKNCFSRN